jgi:cytochrome c oxidase cbb3-type subunit 3
LEDEVMAMARLVLAGVLAALALQADDDDRLVASPATVEAGRHLFQEACSACHGQNGAGGHGPSLVDGRRVNSLNDAQLLQSIQKGVPGTDMPPSPLPEPQLKQVAAFVRSLGAPAIDTVAPGDPDAGRRIFFGKGGCATCHAIAGRGGYLGPDLTDAGTSRSLNQLRESLLEPNKRIAEGFEAVSVTMRDGTRLRGIAKNHDNYSIQLLDSAGKLHLVARADTDKIEIGERSLMPNDFARRLSAGEIRDTLAFLSRQAVRPRESK